VVDEEKKLRCDFNHEKRIKELNNDVVLAESESKRTWRDHREREIDLETQIKAYEGTLSQHESARYLKEIKDLKENLRYAESVRNGDRRDHILELARVQGELTTEKERTRALSILVADMALKAGAR
jgi:hypothetical protein